MKLHLLENRSIGGYVSLGSCWMKGEATEADFALIGTQGEQIPVQSDVVARWHDGSAKWVRHSADSSLMGEAVEVVCKKQNPLDTQIRLSEEEGGYSINAGRMTLLVPYVGSHTLATGIRLDGRLRVRQIMPVFDLERKEESDGETITRTMHCQGVVQKVAIEATGPLVCVVKYTGYFCEEQELMPFLIRMTIGLNSDELRFEHTFFYNGEEDRDFLKGMGLRFQAVLTGNPYNRHVKYAADYGIFHEMAVLLDSNHPRTGPAFKIAQLSGENIAYPPSTEIGVLLDQLDGNLPVWNRYLLAQSSASAYQITKQTKRTCCMLDVRAGRRAHGTMAVSGEDGGVLLGLRDFWQRYPSGLEVEGLAKDSADCTVWFYCPEANAMDFRHYADKSYPLTNYEGFEEVGASAYGVATTSECSLLLTNAFPTDAAVAAFDRHVQKPAIYVATPEEYHARRAFGYWSLPCTDTAEERALEKMLDQAIAYYQGQVDQRNWYGLFNYGDFMHSYDPQRHCWKYDFGGCAWDNTELVPTYWLWLYFMRTGREDVFSMAEAMSRHASETDMYHFGPMRGIGSRHNVRHWGCSCKEPRVSMAGHHRPLYYLTGDRRLEDVFDEVKDADVFHVNLQHFYREEESGERYLTARTGPDWAAFVSDWATDYERTLNPKSLGKIITGIESIAKAPLRLASGPSFKYDPETGFMDYIGESPENIHLTVCMGGPQVWLEAADAIDSEALREMVADYGKLYLMTDEERKAAVGALVEGKPFGMPFVAAGMAAFAAARKHDSELARRAWETIMKASPHCHNPQGFASTPYAVTDTGEALTEIPWASTNHAAQWCLNVIMTLEFARDSLPSFAYEAQLTAGHTWRH